MLAACHRVVLLPWCLDGEFACPEPVKRRWFHGETSLKMTELIHGEWFLVENCLTQTC